MKAIIVVFTTLFSTQTWGNCQALTLVKCFSHQEAKSILVTGNARCQAEKDQIQKKAMAHLEVFRKDLIDTYCDDGISSTSVVFQSEEKRHFTMTYVKANHTILEHIDYFHY